ncbi:MAG: Na(+)-translocating NADH-quinone reductase subunit A [Deltaproteobacteria bacterium]|nr:MAG: Na(+)-translocating NADH-quinone reductase subunit A [Deltaproteobacteria bacterium]
MIKIKKGLSLPLKGNPQQTIEDTKRTKTVAINGLDYVGMKPTMLVKEGDTVQIGQPLFTDKKNEGVIFTAPAAGKVLSINRGAKRVFQSLVIQVAASESQVDIAPPRSLDPKSIASTLVETGLWTSFRTRPYSKIPAVGSTPNSIFITAMDTNPLAADPELITSEHVKEFERGLQIISKLTEGKTYLCKEAGKSIPSVAEVEVKEFKGVHPAGNAGTHIHFIDPVSDKKTVWYIGYQDVIAIGKFFALGEFWTERVISLAGPLVKKPRLIRTRLGANCMDIVNSELVKGKEARIISGPVWKGHRCDQSYSYLGRYHNQISVLEEGTKREFLGWNSPGFNKFSITRTFLSALNPAKTFALNSSTHGSPRAMIPIGMFEKVMPLDILPVPLLKSLITGNTDLAQKLGALELDEEDLALCTFADTGKVDYGPMLRETLTTIEREG